MGIRLGLRAFVVLAMLATTLVTAATHAAAVPAIAGASFDSFDDGDASDWIFFGGNAAGGGGGALDDRPKEGAGYLSTGWGGNGTASGFYGGTFKNLDDAAQIALPADPWFNIWVYQQANTTVDAYTLELTLREDTDGNGWTDGAEDSIGLNTVFGPNDFDDDWTLISAPLADWFDRGTGGNGTFDGNVDEMVIVFGGVQGAEGTVIEIDFDEIVFTSGGPAARETVIFDDMEHGDPGNNGWFSFGGAVGGGGLGPNNTDLPPADGGGFSIETGWGSGGQAGFYGGFGRTNATDISGAEYFNFWINPNADQDYTLEINLQEDDNSDGAINQPDDDEFQYNCVVSPVGPCAVAGGGWQLVSLPLGDFFDDGGFLFGGNGELDPTSPALGGNGELINVVFAVIGNTGSDVNFRTDYWTFTTEAPSISVPDSGTVIDDFETGVSPGTPCAPAVPPLNFCTFNGAGSSVTLSNPTTPPAPVLPELGEPNSVLQMDVDVTSFAGFIQGFDDGAGNWTPQNWSTSEGISLWMFGTGSGTQMFIDVLDNRNPGSETDDAERYTVAFTDDFTGWQLLEFPFTTFVRKEIGNGAPADGFTLFEVHGYAIGTLGTDGAISYYFDNVSLYGEAEPPAVAVQFATQNTFIDEGATGDVVVKLNRPLGPDDPDQVSIDYATERSNAVAGEEYVPTSGTLTFVKDGPSELSFSIQTFDDTKFEGDEQIVIRLTNPVDVERGTLYQGSAFVADNDPFDPNDIGDFERGTFLWDATGDAEIAAVRSEAGSADARPGQDAVENVAVVSVPQSVELMIEGRLCIGSPRGVVVVSLLSTTLFDATSIDADSVTFGDATPISRRGDVVRKIEDKNGDGLDDVVFQFRRGDINAGCDPEAVPFNGVTLDGTAITTGGADAAIVRDFALGQDWTGTETMSFWYYGGGGGDEVTVTLKDNRAPDPGPAGWNLVWSDEFNEAAGTPPNPDNWAYEIGDTTPDGKNGWGNEELQYYTDDPANAATDGDGNLVITLTEADGSQECYYGACEFESARLITQNRAEFAYGRIESRLMVPDGGDGLWPAFWSLGTDITYNPWPGAGEIDVMEYVSRLPTEIFGTVHGPGYSGGGSIGDIYDFGAPVSDDYHTFAVEWQPNLIVWYVDDIEYHRATPDDVPGPWVFEKPFFLLLNFAIGGNFGGAIDPDNTYPQEYMVDYIRVYQGPDTAERFEASFTDDFVGWQEVMVPMADFTRSADQPAGAPDDGLGLDEVWGYGLSFDEGSATGEVRIDQVTLVPVPPATDLVVTSTADSGPGSLREALGLIADGGTITVDPALAGSTISLSSQLTVDRSVTVDASAAPLTISAGGNSRVLQVEPGASVSISDVVLRDGVAGPQGGGVLNYGTLSLDRVVVRDNAETSAGPANFEFGGGGVYNASGATLNLTDSTVADNTSVNHPGGGVYGFFGSTINITRSTISGNVSGDVAGGLRSLGNANIVNSTFSANVSTVWHGGGIFHTDGELTVTNSTFADNVAPAGTASGILVATFGAPANATLTNNVIEGNGGAFACAIEGGGAATITSGGGNVISDGSCNPGDSDVSNTDALLGSLTDNGGLTLTHGLDAGSPAIGAAEAGSCPATDQRGVARDAACDSGAYEFD